VSTLLINWIDNQLSSLIAKESIYQRKDFVKPFSQAHNTLHADHFQEAMEHIEELEVQANSLRKDLEKLQKQ
jgi:hypothetical protein